MTDNRPYDALLLVSFGGPEGMDDVIPFLENVLRGRDVPRERMIEVSHHYEQFGGVSPINEQNRDLINALEAVLADAGPNLPIYFGNRNWHPMLSDTMQQMADDGVQRVLCFFTSMFSCYSGCRQYRENLFEAHQSLEGDVTMSIDKIRMAYNHPRFIQANVEHVIEALEKFDSADHPATKILFTAHSIPTAMANGSRYVDQLSESSRLVMERLQAEGYPVTEWELVYQSRSGSPQIPWLEPDVNSRLTELKEDGLTHTVILPIGFISDHMEVLFDLDVEAVETCKELGIEMARAKSVGTHPEFVGMIRDLIIERINGDDKVAIGQFAANHDVCPANCCLPGRPGAELKPSLAQLG